MSRYAVAATSPELADLVDRVLTGDEVVITRHDQPVVELRVVDDATRYPVGSSEWLFARTMARPGIGITSLELLRQVEEEGR